MRRNYSQRLYFNETFFCFLEIGRYQVMVTIVSGLSIMGASLENMSIGYVMPYAKCDLNLTPSEQGVLAAISYLGIVSTSYL